MPGGVLFDRDWDVLMKSVARICERFRDESIIEFVEIGTHVNNTSRDLIAVVRQLRSGKFIYHGIDYYPTVFEDSDYVHHQGLSHLISDEIGVAHWVFVDGCHCEMCVARDGTLYGSKLVTGGEMCFHDASANGQGGGDERSSFMKEHHDEVEAAKGIQVRRALNTNRFLGFKLTQPALAQGLGGVEVYERIQGA